MLKIAPIAELPLINTPKKAQDIQQVVNNLKGKISPNYRIIKRLLNKVGKALDLVNIKRAGLETEINHSEEDFK